MQNDLIEYDKETALCKRCSEEFDISKMQLIYNPSENIQFPYCSDCYKLITEGKVCVNCGQLHLEEEAVCAECLSEIMADPYRADQPDYYPPSELRGIF